MNESYIKNFFRWDTGFCKRWLLWNSFLISKQTFKTCWTWTRCRGLFYCKERISFHSKVNSLGFLNWHLIIITTNSRLWKTRKIQQCTFSETIWKNTYKVQASPKSEASVCKGAASEEIMRGVFHVLLHNFYISTSQTHSFTLIAYWLKIAFKIQAIRGNVSNKKNRSC